MSFDYTKLCEENILDYGRKEEHLELLGKLYADDTHFIYELLQNAEDAEAKSILFQLFDDRLEIRHNGRIFSKDDVKAITRIESTKEEYTKIGKFGLGFKSVYAITDIPQIYSGNFHFHIEKYIRPAEISAKEIDSKWTTLFILPFKVANKEKIYKKISIRLRDLNIRTLLFLKHIEDIEYNIGDDYGQYLREKSENKNGLNQVIVIGQEENETLLVFNSEINNKKIEIAFLYDDKKKTISPAKNTNLFVYFPTEKETKLGFIINGNFRTTPARDNVPEDDEHNKILVDMVVELLTEAIRKIKSANLCNISFLECLPIITSDFPENKMFYPLFKKVKEILFNEEYLPTHNDKFTRAENAVIARSSELIDLYNPDGKTWLSKEITQDNHPDLFSYLQNIMSVQIIAPDTFARWIDKNFLEKQKDDWFIQFYDFLNGQRALWREKSVNQPEGILRSKSILRLENNELRTLKEDVFLPIENASIYYPTIKKVIADKKESLAFLKALGLEMPKPADRIIQIIFPKYESEPSVSDEEYKKDLEQILSVMKGESEDDKNKLRRYLSNLIIVKCDDGIFRKVDEVYCNDKDLKEWFKHSKNIHFVNNTLSSDNWNLLGVAKLPRKLQRDILPNSIDIPYYTRYHSPYYARYHRIKNYDLDGLNDFYNNMISNNEAKFIAKIMISEYNADKEFFQGEHEWFYQKDRRESFYNNIFHTLVHFTWILGNDGKLYKPTDIAKEDIAEDISSVFDLPFPFKKSEEKELEDSLAKQGKKIVDAAEYNEFQKWKESQNKNELQILDEDKLEPECPVKDAIITEALVTPKPNDTGTRVSKKSTFEESTAGNSPNTAANTSTSSPEKAKEIGQRGEEIVKHWLIDKEGYKEEDIKILNDEENIGIGRDFEVWRNGELIKIIEVKATIEIYDHEFKVSGKQWETGRREQDKYWIYTVFGVYSKYPTIVKIQNPIKKWKEGEIRADPVNFIISVNPPQPTSP